MTKIKQKRLNLSQYMIFLS